jgi:hypothetical protein
MFQKHSYVRSKKLLKLVAGLDCQACGSGQHGAGRTHKLGWWQRSEGVKADDNLVAALCLKCHYEIDQGKDMSKEERQELWEQAHIATVKKLYIQGLWPVDVPIPSFTIEPQLSSLQGL